LFIFPFSSVPVIPRLNLRAAAFFFQLYLSTPFPASFSFPHEHAVLFDCRSAVPRHITPHPSFFKISLIPSSLFFHFSLLSSKTQRHASPRVHGSLVLLSLPWTTSLAPSFQLRFLFFFLLHVHALSLILPAFPAAAAVPGEWVCAEPRLVRLVHAHASSWSGWVVGLVWVQAHAGFFTGESGGALAWQRQRQRLGQLRLGPKLPVVAASNKADSLQYYGFFFLFYCFNSRPWRLLSLQRSSFPSPLLWTTWATFRLVLSTSTRIRVIRLPLPPTSLPS
ncbi:hypothetical protein Vafri_14465, partial [Volvox africanus]